MHTKRMHAVIGELTQATNAFRNWLTSWEFLWPICGWEASPARLMPFLCSGHVCVCVCDEIPLHVRFTQSSGRRFNGFFFAILIRIYLQFHFFTLNSIQFTISRFNSICTIDFVCRRTECVLFWFCQRMNRIPKSFLTSFAANWKVKPKIWRRSTYSGIETHTRSVCWQLSKFALLLSLLLRWNVNTRCTNAIHIYFWKSNWRRFSHFNISLFWPLVRSAATLSSNSSYFQ